MKHLLDISSDDSTVCGMDTRGTTFEYDLGKSGHDEVIDLSDLPTVFIRGGVDAVWAREAEIDCPYCAATMEGGS